MIKSVRKIKEGTYLLNDTILISNIDFLDNHIQYNLKYDENTLLTTAQEIADDFILQALKSVSENA